MKINKPDTTHLPKVPPASNLLPSVLEALAEWDVLVEAKWKELRHKARRGFRPFLSLFSPQWTMQHDGVERRKTRQMLMDWTVTFFYERGISVECIADADNNDGFGIREANGSSFILCLT